MQNTDYERSRESGAFVDYCVRYLSARKGLREDRVPPELEPLRAACDRILVRTDGMNFIVFCIVDRVAAPERRFGASAAALRDIARQCLKLTGRGGMTRMPVGFYILEIGEQPVSAKQRARLSVYRRPSMFSKTHLGAFALDIDGARCWTNTPAATRWTYRRLFERLAAPPPHAMTADADGTRLTGVATGRPWVTFALAALCVLAFAAELIYAVAPKDGMLSVGTRTLVALGAVEPGLVLQQGEWFRLFTSFWLHGGLVHIAFNLFALLLAGFAVERLLGRAWFAAVFVAAALVGEGFSLVWIPAGTVTIGASGGIMGLLAAGFVCSFRLVDNSERLGIQARLLFVLVPSLIPLSTPSDIGGATDYAAHFGGAIAGLSLGLIFHAGWRRFAVRAPWQPLATALLAAALAASLVSVRAVARGYADHAVRFIPDDEIPADRSGIRARADELAHEYPDDPRGHYYYGRVLLAKRQAASAEHQFRLALADYDAHQAAFIADFGQEIRVFLSLSLALQDKTTEARREAAPACEALAAGDAREALNAYDLCR